MEVNSPFLDRVKIAGGKKSAAALALGRGSREKQNSGNKGALFVLPTAEAKEANSRKDPWNLRRSHMNK